MSADDPTPPLTPVEAPSDRRFPHLIALNGPEIGTTFRLSKPRTILGAGIGTDFQVADAKVSPRHAVLTLKRDGSVWIEDAGSRHGTFIGVERVLAPTLVRDGANIVLGASIILRFNYSSTASKALRRLAQARARLKMGKHLLDILRGEHAYSRRHGTPLALLYIRADAVPTVGQAGGALRDEAMGILGLQIDSVVRTEDSVARSGPDEFVILLRGDGNQALALAERLRAGIASRAVVPGSTPAFHTITAAVVPIRAVGVQTVSSDLHGPASAEDILSTARALAGRVFHENTNAVVRVQPLVM